MTRFLKQWQHIQNACINQRLPQAMLFVGPGYCGLDEFVNQVAQYLFCMKKTTMSCGACPDCLMLKNHEHPDIEWIKPEKKGTSIKIDQIRALQSSAYLTPKRAPIRVIVIEAADKLNTAAANALLKVLEEPPKSTMFLLMAQQVSTIIPTVLSRCVLLSFFSNEDAFTDNLLKLGEQYPEDSEHYALIKQSESMLQDLINLCESKEHPCILASKWTAFELEALLWFLYLVLSQLQKMHAGLMLSDGPSINQLRQLNALLSPMFIFSFIDKINTLLRKISHNMNVNKTLVLEDLLFFIQNR